MARPTTGGDQPPSIELFGLLSVMRGAALALFVIPLIYLARPDLVEGLPVRITEPKTTAAWGS